jgi:hypothetical protein
MEWIRDMHGLHAQVSQAVTFFAERKRVRERGAVLEVNRRVWMVR